VRPTSVEAGAEGGGPDGARPCQRRTYSRGPNGPSRGQNVDTPGGTSAWSQTAEVFVADGKFAEALVADGQVTEELVITGFDLRLPLEAEIAGIVVTVRRASGRSGIYDQGIRLAFGSTRSKSSKASMVPGGAGGERVDYGQQDDLWEEGWTPEEVNDPTFGVSIVARAGTSDAGTDADAGSDAGVVGDGGVGFDAGAPTALVDHVGISVFYDTCSL
jgi:hypothetical protein